MLEFQLDNNEYLDYDHVVLASHADQSLDIIRKPN